MNKITDTPELTEEQYEQIVTMAMAKTFDFTLRERDAVCNTCGRRLQKNYVGMPINERMILHARGHNH